MNSYKFNIRSDGNADVSALVPDEAQGIDRVDVNVSKKLVRIVADNIGSDEIVAWAQKKGVRLELYRDNEVRKTDIIIDGMTCHSCEVTLERALGKIAGISKVNAHASSGVVRLTHHGGLQKDSIREAVREQGYSVRSIGANGDMRKISTKSRPSFSRFVGFLVLAGAIGILLNQFNLLVPSGSLGDNVGFGAVFLLGLFAASSSCIAVSGGLLLSSAAQWNEQYGSQEGLRRMQPVFFFVFGRLVSYLCFGALIGFVGQALSPSPLITGVITVCAAVFMIIMGLDMLGLAPQWLKSIVPHMPKRISHTVLRKESSHSAFAPLLLGGATFFLPCGFTQSLQLYALTTGSPLTSALLLFIFALGTAPALFGLGWASTSLKGKAGTFFFQFSGVVVILLGVWNIQNGFTAAGYPLALPQLSFGSNLNAANGNVEYDGKEQIVRMIASSRGYSPNSFVVRAGIPVKWIVDGTNAEGCASVFQAPQLGIKKLLSRGDNIFEFTPDKPGTYAFSCSMGMYRGAITVVPNT